MPLSPGTKLAHYEASESVAAGGISRGRTERGTRSSNATLPSKFFPRSSAQPKERLERFQRDAKLLAQVNHYEHRYPPWDSSSMTGQKFLVVALLPERHWCIGCHAASHCQSARPSRYPFRSPRGWKLRMKRASFPVVLKPPNIKETLAGKPKILDFGSSKASGCGGRVPNDSSRETDSDERHQARCHRGNRGVYRAQSKLSAKLGTRGPTSGHSDVCSSRW